MDAYAYASNNPVLYTDPMGLWPELPSPGDLVKGVTNVVSEGVGALGEAAQDVGEFAVRNRDTIASVGAVAACIGTVGTGCVAATAAAVGIRSEKRFRENGVNRETVGVAVFDGVFSWATLVLVKIPAQLATARLADPLARGVSVVTGRLSRLAIDAGMSGLFGGLGFLARRHLDRGLNQANC